MEYSANNAITKTEKIEIQKQQQNKNEKTRKRDDQRKTKQNYKSENRKELQK